MAENKKVLKLEGKVALVTGSSQGIGQAIAIRLAEEGADIIIDYRSHPEGAEETKAKVEATGRKGFVVKADLGIVSDVHRMVSDGIQHFGKLDILVNNAGLEKNASFWDVTEEDYDNVLNVNLKGVFFATQAIVKHLIETKRSGKIINISSVHEELPFPHFTSYCVSKGGVKMFTENETNFERLFGVGNASPYVKDGINNYIIEDRKDAVNPDEIGTKVAANYVLTIAPGETKIVQLRLCDAPDLAEPFGDNFGRILGDRIREADEFYQRICPFPISDDERNVQQQAFAGLLWSKQFYYYVVEDWLKGHRFWQRDDPAGSGC